MVRPAQTPRAEVVAKATVAPTQTASGMLVLLKATTAIWVLSPNSATVISKNVAKKILRLAFITDLSGKDQHITGERGA